MANPLALSPLSGAASPASPGFVLPAMGHVFYLKFVTQFLYSKKVPLFVTLILLRRRSFSLRWIALRRQFAQNVGHLSLTKKVCTNHRSTSHTTPRHPAGVRKQNRNEKWFEHTFLAIAITRPVWWDVWLCLVWFENLDNHNVNIRVNLQYISVRLSRLVQSLPGVTVDLFLPILTLWTITMSDYQLCLFTLLHIVMVGIISDRHVYRRFPSPYRSIISP